ncbi:MAG: relaxase/mobilization nuclease domain-containing protein [Dehalobacter sp.]|nr:relaxase/mobilization nuclease domain-containing protein [Dehalobacter sp.]
MNDTAKLLEAEGVLAGTTGEIIRSFAMQRSGRREVKQPVGHIPLSFAPEDKERMTNDFMVQLAKEYMEEMGIRNTQYIIVRHYNTGNEHLHIVYNRIDNDLKLISVNHDYKRNIIVCKKLKDKHGLTYGKGKDKVKREKLKNPDKVKYHIYDAIKAVLPQCKDEKEFQFLLLKSDIKTEFKLKKTTGEVEGLSFRHGDFSFKGSQVDRKFSYGNLKKVFEKNQLEEEKQLSKIEENRVIRGVEITPAQQTILRNGGWIYLENMNRDNGKGKVSSYVFLNDEKSRLFFSKEHPSLLSGLIFPKWQKGIIGLFI